MQALWKELCWSYYDKEQEGTKMRGEKTKIRGLNFPFMTGGAQHTQRS